MKYLINDVFVSRVEKDRIDSFARFLVGYDDSMAEIPAVLTAGYVAADIFLLLSYTRYPPGLIENVFIRFTFVLLAKCLTIN